MKKSHLPEDFYLSLTEFLLHAKQQVVGISAEFGLSSMQALTLLLTGSGELRPMNSFCKLYDCDASNITGIVDGLEQKGLVSRQPHPGDRRIKVIRLEPAGKKMRRAIASQLAAQSGSLFSGLSTSEIEQLAQLIQKVASANQLPAYPLQQQLSRV
jgi:DNA-binding MarR family transcriptional regulator